LSAQAPQILNDVLVRGNKKEKMAEMRRSGNLKGILGYSVDGTIRNPFWPDCPGLPIMDEG
jgi:hypothetical protein